MSGKSHLPSSFCVHLNLSRAIGGSEDWGESGVCVADWCQDCGAVGIRMTTENCPDTWLSPAFSQVIKKDIDELRLLSVLMERLGNEAVEIDPPCLADSFFNVAKAAMIEREYLNEEIQR
jgi:hypothetical protein